MRSIACRLYALLFATLGGLSMLTGLVVLCSLVTSASPGAQTILAQPLSMGLFAAMAAIGAGCIASGFLFASLSLLAGSAARSVQPTAHYPAERAATDPGPAQPAAA